jgi:hypothetical protein
VLACHRPVDVALGFAILDGVAFIVLGLAFGEADEHLGEAVLEVHLQRHDGHALDLGLLGELENFTLVSEQGADAGGCVLALVAQGAGRAVLADVHAVQGQLHRRGAGEDIALLQGDVAGADALDLAAAERDADLDGLKNVIIEPRFAVLDVGIVVARLVLGGGHGLDGTDTPRGCRATEAMNPRAVGEARIVTERTPRRDRAPAARGLAATRAPRARRRGRSRG